MAFLFPIVPISSSISGGLCTSLPRNRKIYQCSKSAPHHGQHGQRSKWTASTAQAPLTVDAADNTRLKFKFSYEAAAQLSSDINMLISSFQEIAVSAKEGKRIIQKSLDYRFQADDIVVHIECNPNIFPDAFSAKVYITLDDGTIKVNSEALLTRLIENVRVYKQVMSV